MSRATQILAVGLFVCVLSSPTSGTKSFKFPMLFFDYEDIQEMRKKAATTHWKIAQEIQVAARELKNGNNLIPPASNEVFSASRNEIYANRLGANAMYCLLYPEDSKAFKRVTLVMDRLASYHDWYERSRPTDDLPIAISLTGFATAFDFLYPRFDSRRRRRYLGQLDRMTGVLYGRLMRPVGWSKHLIHNHAPTNLVAILLGSLLLERNDGYPNAVKWRKKSVEALENGMELLSYVIDGTSDEGVSYGSFSSRGWTQYAFLARRHFNVNHSDSPWFRAHFWYFYATLLPGFQGTVGIADSNLHWFHGPESQLRFLDSFVLKNGFGNWLADRVRAHRATEPPFAVLEYRKYTCLHTEFIFYNASIEARRPKLPSGGKMHLFNDWGVATYGGGLDAKEGTSFLSMKSGVLNGEAAADMVEGRLQVPFVEEGWGSFNAGHEHHDQNSFVFAPNGRHFITDALYADKKAYLDNAPLFYPHPESQCHPYWQGQTGGCSRWLKYRENPVPRGRLVSTETLGEMVHFCGEAVGAYPSFLKLKSIQRSMILLRYDLLLVLDSIYLHEDSKITKASVNFHNIITSFKEHQHRDLRGAKVTYPDGDYSFIVIRKGGGRPLVALQSELLTTELNPRNTSFVNVTFDLDRLGPTHVAYLFYGPKTAVTSCDFTSRVNDDVTEVLVDVNGGKYLAKFASVTSSLKERMREFGFGAYAGVSVNGGETKVFGAPKRLRESASLSDALEMPKGSLVRSRGHTKECSYQSLLLVHCTTGVFLIFVSCCTLAFAFRGIRKFHLGLAERRCIKQLIVSILFCLMFLKVCLEVNVRCKAPLRFINIFTQEDSPSSPPTVFVISLPGAGGEIIGSLFRNSSDFLYFNTKDVAPPLPDAGRLDPCHWTSKTDHATLSSWFTSIATDPLAFVKSLRDTNPYVHDLKKRQMQMAEGTTFAVNLQGGFWNSKLMWLHELLLPATQRYVIIVRDPRDWIFSLIRQDLNTEQKQRQFHTIHEVLHAETALCDETSYLAPEYKEMRTVTPIHKLEERLARIWRADVTMVLRTSPSAQVVRFEDIMTSPESVARKMMQGLGTTLSAPQINRFIRTVRSGHYGHGYEPRLSSHTIYQWKKKLPAKTVSKIENVCKDTMNRLGYGT